MKSKTLLYINTDFVYPPNHGGRVDMWNRIRSLVEIGYSVDLVCTVKERPEEKYIRHVEQVVHKLYLCDRKNRLIDMLNPVLITACF